MHSHPAFLENNCQSPLIASIDESKIPSNISHSLTKIRGRKKRAPWPMYRCVYCNKTYKNLVNHQKWKHPEEIVVARCYAQRVYEDSSKSGHGRNGTTRMFEVTTQSMNFGSTEPNIFAASTISTFDSARSSDSPFASASPMEATSTVASDRSSSMSTLTAAGTTSPHVVMQFKKTTSGYESTVAEMPSLSASMGTSTVYTSGNDGGDGADPSTNSLSVAAAAAIFANIDSSSNEDIEIIEQKPQIRFAPTEEPIGGNVDNHTNNVIKEVFYHADRSNAKKMEVSYDEKTGKLKATIKFNRQ